MLYGDRSYKKVPQYEENELRPNQRNPLRHDGDDRGVLDQAMGYMPIQDYNDSSDYPSRSPASASFTPGLPSRSKSKKGDEGNITIQPGIPRVR